MSGVTVEFFGGLRVIGSSKIMVSTPSARVLLDMGMDMPGEHDLFRDPVVERPASRLRDRLAVGAMPALPGVYDPAQLDPGSPLAEPDARPTAIVLSHAHLDHDGALDFVRPDVPVYAHPDTVAVAAAIALSGTGVARVPLPLTAPLQLGDLTVEIVPVDHDVPGACGVLVHTPDGTLAYTGDLNFHRGDGRRSRAFVEAVRGVRMLVTETTLLSFDPGPEPRPPRSEDEVVATLVEAMAVAPGLVLLSTYERDVERAARLVATARAHGRTLVWPGQQATVLAHVGVPGVVTWDATRPQRPGHRAAVARLGGAAPSEVGLADVVAAPSAYVVVPDVGDVPALLDLPRGAGYLPFVHAQGPPMGPFVTGWATWQEWLDALGMTYVAAGSTGHATGEALHAMVRAIDPEVVVPIHGFRPEALVVATPTLLAEYGVRYGVDGKPR